MKGSSDVKTSSDAGARDWKFSFPKSLKSKRSSKQLSEKQKPCSAKQTNSSDSGSAPLMNNTLSSGSSNDSHGARVVAVQGTKILATPDATAPTLEIALEHRSASYRSTFIANKTLGQREKVPPPIIIDKSPLPVQSELRSPPSVQRSQTKRQDEAAAGKDTTKQSYGSLLSKTTFRQTLDDPVGLYKFGNFLAGELSAEQLCFWLNAEQHRVDFMRLCSLTRRIHDLHVPNTAPLALNISHNERATLHTDVDHFLKLPDPYFAAREAAFTSMHMDAWPRFVKHRLSLAQNASLRSRSDQRRANFIEAFCIVDAKTGTDQPITMISQGFEAMTGYTLDHIIGHNCRFLQGPGTSKSAVSRIRHAAKLGLPAQELLLNYRIDGTPMWILLRMEPLRDVEGTLTGFLGHQFIVHNRMNDLAYLVSDELDEDTAPPDSMQHQQTELMRGHISTHLNAAQLARPATRNQRAGNNFAGRPHSRGSQAGATIPDRDQRLKDATALAFDVTANRPSSGSKPSPTSFTSTSTAKAGARPTSAAGQRIGVLLRQDSYGRPVSAATHFDKTMSDGGKLDSRLTAESSQMQEQLEEDAAWQSESLAHFAIIDPASSKILFSSPALPVDWAQDESLFTPIQKHNPPSAVSQIKKAIAAREPLDIVVNLRIFTELETQAQPVSLAFTPMIGQGGQISRVVVLFGL